MFSNYSLVLFKKNEILYSSKYPGLRPIIDCIDKHRFAHEDCTLYDKVIGLAAAKLIVYSQIISRVKTQIISKQARKFLENNNIIVRCETEVENILTKDKTKICPMELKAQNFEDNKQFFLELKNLFLIS